MAIWQYDFFLEPISNNDFLENLVTEEALSRLATVLPEGKHWAKGARLFGDLDGTCVELLLEGKLIEEISCRLDLSNLKKEQVAAIINFSNECKLQTVIYIRKSYPTTYKSLKELVLASPQHKFLKDPHKYFDKLNNSQ